MSTITISFQVLPSGLPDKAATYAAVDAAIAVVEASGLPYTVGAMETTMEGEYETIMGVVRQAIDAVIAAGASKAFVNMKIDYDPNGSTIDEKLAKYRPA